MSLRIIKLFMHLLSTNVPFLITYLRMLNVVSLNKEKYLFRLLLRQPGIGSVDFELNYGALKKKKKI